MSGAGGWLAAAAFLLGGCATQGTGLQELRRGDAEYDAGRLAAAAAHYGRALEDFALTPPMVLRAQRQRGEAQLARRRYDEAVQSFSDALQMPSNNPSELFTRRGMALLAWGYYERAAEDFDAALRWTGEFAPALDGIAQMSRRRAMPGAAFAALQRLQAVAPLLALTHIAAGNHYLLLAQDAKAIKAFDEAVRREPDSAAARLARGRAHFVAARYPQAISDFEAGQARQPRADPSTLVWLHVARGRAGGDGQDALRAGTAKLPERGWPDPVISFVLGETGAEELGRVARQGPSPAAAALQVCEAETWMGEAALLRGDSGAAAGHFQRSQDACPRDLAEFALAGAELRRLNAPLSATPGTEAGAASSPPPVDP